MPNESNPQLIVDLGALERNYRAVQDLTRARVAAVVKADAYGLGLEGVAKALSQFNCETFFTALASEGAELRALLPDAEIFVLSPLIEADADLLLSNDLKPCLYDIEQIREFVTRAKDAGRLPAAALHVETGINRLGLDDEGLNVFRSDSIAQELQVDHLMSHLACADEPDSTLNPQQLERFRVLRTEFPEATASLANSAGTFLGPEYHFDIVRVGIALFGHDPHYRTHEPRVEPVATLQASLGQIKTVPVGNSVGYGATVTCEKPTRVGTVLAGYADGIPRSLGDERHAGIASVAIADGWVPLFGRISMDLITVNLSAVDAIQATVGDTVEFFGRKQPIEVVAEQAGTIPYELLTSVGSRVVRVYRQ